MDHRVPAEFPSSSNDENCHYGHNHYGRNNELTDDRYSDDPELNEIGRKLLTLGAQINAATCTYLMLLAEFDRRGGWEVEGVPSCAHWLSWQGGITPGTAREKVRVAKALCELPGICDAFSQGKLSYSQVRALTRVASRENEQFLLHIAEHGTAAHLENLVRKYRLYKEDVEDYEFSTFELRDVDWYEDDRGMTVIKARLTHEQGEVVIKALKECVFTLNGEDRITALDAEREAALKSAMVNNVSAEVSADVSTGVSDDVSAETETPEEGDQLAGKQAHNNPTHDDTMGQKRADALTRIAKSWIVQQAQPLSADNKKAKRWSGGDHYAVSVVVDAADLQEVSNSEKDAVNPDTNPSPNRVSAETLRRIGCDCSFIAAVRGDHGRLLNIGRKTRVIPGAIRRALDLRDGGCTYPGCTHTHFVDAHHIKHWLDGGETRLDNLTLLCDRHHTLVHEKGYQVRISNMGRVTFHDQFGNDLCTPRQFPPRGADEHTSIELFNAQRGIYPTDEDIASKWDGSRISYWQCVEELGDLDGVEYAFMRSPSTE